MALLTNCSEGSKIEIGDVVVTVIKIKKNSVRVAVESPSGKKATVTLPDSSSKLTKGK